MYFRQTNLKRRIFLKQCPRCSGDLSADSDQYGSYVHCLQCGYMADIKQPRATGIVNMPIVRDNVA